MSDPIKLCPFCGTEAEAYKEIDLASDDPDTYYVQCHQGHRLTLDYPRPAKARGSKEIIWQWERRWSEEALQVRITELEAENERLQKVVGGLLRVVKEEVNPAAFAQDTILWAARTLSGRGK